MQQPRACEDGNRQGKDSKISDDVDRRRAYELREQTGMLFAEPWMDSKEPLTGRRWKMLRSKESPCNVDDHRH